MTMFSRTDKDPVPTTKPAPPTGVTRAAVPSARTGRDAPSGGAYPARISSMSVISKALKITGQLESTEDIHIEGEIEGDVARRR